MKKHCNAKINEDEGVEEWKVVRGMFLAINVANMSCACSRSIESLSPRAHLADGSADFITICKCSWTHFLRYLVSHTNQDDLSLQLSYFHRFKGNLQKNSDIASLSGNVEFPSMEFLPRGTNIFPLPHRLLAEAQHIFVSCCIWMKCGYLPPLHCHSSALFIVSLLQLVCFCLFVSLYDYLLFCLLFRFLVSIVSQLLCHRKGRIKIF